MACTVRPAVPEDIPSVNAIHRHYVLNTVITFVTEPNSDETMLANYNKVKDEGLPFIVAVNNDSKNVVGYTYATSFRGVKPGYRHTLELSLFCAPDQVRKGIGRQLLERLMSVLRNPEDWKDYFEGTRLFEYPPKQLMAIMAIDVDMPGGGYSLRGWYSQFGFEQRGYLKEVGWKNERWIDTVYMQKQLRS